MQYELKRIAKPGSSKLTCSAVDEQLVCAKESLLTLPARVHLRECLRCQAEFATYRRLRAILGSLAKSPVRIDPTMEDEILQRLDEAAQRSNGSLRSVAKTATASAAAIGGIVATATVIVLSKRQRRVPRLAI